MFGKCPSAVLNLLKSYDAEKRNLANHIFIDNLFTTVPLFFELDRKCYNGTGTIRENHIDENCPISKTTNSVKKESRWYSDCVAGRIGNSDFMVTIWKDNSVVTMASTAQVETTFGNAKRGSRQEK